MKNNFIIKAAPLFLLIFIDSMGLGLVFPIITSVIMNPASHFLSLSDTNTMRNFLYGFTISSFMICWFLGAAYLGDLSDSIGRKRSLMICLIGAAIGYFISAVGITVNSLILLILGRIIAGLTAGSQAIAQAAVVDLSNEEDKAANIGLIMFSASLGFVLGPLIGGVFSDNHLIPWFNLATPMYFALFLSVINTLALIYFYQQDSFIKKKITIKWFHSFSIFISAFQNKKVRGLSTVLFIGIFSWSCYYTFIAAYLFKKFQFSTQRTGVYLSLLAIGFAVGTTLLIRIYDKFLKQQTALMLSLISATLFGVITIMAKTPVMVWLSVVPLSAAIGLFYTLLVAMMSDQVPADHQGWVMGISNSICAAAFGISGFSISMLMRGDCGLPILLAAIGFAMASVTAKLQKIA